MGTATSLSGNLFSLSGDSGMEMDLLCNAKACAVVKKWGLDVLIFTNMNNMKYTENFLPYFSLYRG
jgi:hypothetical protein